MGMWAQTLHKLTFFRKRNSNKGTEMKCRDAKVRKLEKTSREKGERSYGGGKKVSVFSLCLPWNDLLIKEFVQPGGKDAGPLFKDFIFKNFF